MELYLSGEKSFVKHQFACSGATAASINNLLSFPTIIQEKYFAGYPFLNHHLKCCFNISH
ncbi:DUF5951 family protein [Klebsiella variicola]|uniref:DUF5951 family protein n=1 Tax=Klebsiella variicola TaxID=244366 RepID=UPI003A5BE98D